MEVSRAFKQISGSSCTDFIASIEEEKDSLSKTKFKYPSYMQDVMGDIFSLGFGPFRWICASGADSDLKLTDETARQCFEQILAKNDCTIFFHFMKK